MPQTIFTVGRIDSTPTAQPGLTRHVITARELIHGLGFQVETVNDFAASLCQRAQQLERPVAVIWRDGRYGKQIVQVDLVPDETRSPDGDGQVITAKPMGGPSREVEHGRTSPGKLEARRYKDAIYAASANTPPPSVPNVNPIAGSEPAESHTRGQVI